MVISRIDHFAVVDQVFGISWILFIVSRICVKSIAGDDETGEARNPLITGGPNCTHASGQRGGIVASTTPQALRQPQF
ncbi:hypothetical protein RRG08_044358 [Elysia crispata]|uniref:Uncharacterized protein n=1 Tax=Elysia crispata TaxID=231223 RepID=A0AAE1A8M2_9GAST|nr:hypothetical protein RRG08_044358 [Elysia crispata]